MWKEVRDKKGKELENGGWKLMRKIKENDYSANLYSNRYFILWNLGGSDKYYLSFLRVFYNIWSL